MEILPSLAIFSSPKLQPAQTPYARVGLRGSCDSVAPHFPTPLLSPPPLRRQFPTSCLDIQGLLTLRVCLYHLPYFSYVSLPVAGTLQFPAQSFPAASLLSSLLLGSSPPCLCFPSFSCFFSSLFLFCSKQVGVEEMSGFRDCGGVLGMV